VSNRRIQYRHALQISGKHHVQKNVLRLVLVTLLLLAVTVWSYWPTIINLSHGWEEDDYSAGQLVPFIAVFLIWRDRKLLGESPLVPYWAGGILLLLLAETVRIYGFLSALVSIERCSLVLMVAGLALMVAGWRVLRRVLWILLFLFLMVPLPNRVHDLISGPLQTMATAGSVFLLEAFGVRISRQGNTMILNGNTPLGVAEACSGLRMLTAFIIVAAFLAYMVKRSRRQKAFLLLSSIPVALICNILRIVVTAVLILNVSTEVAEKFFHDFAGLVMMPTAVMLMFGELRLMNRLTVSEPEPQQVHARARTKPAVKATAKRMDRTKQSA